MPLLIHKGVELENGSDWVNSASDNHEEQVIKDLLKTLAEKPGHWAKVSDGVVGVSEETILVFTASFRWKKMANSLPGYQCQ